MGVKGPASGNMRQMLHVGGGGHPPDDQESMCEGLECKDRRSDLPYYSEEPEDITGSLMKLS